MPRDAATGRRSMPCGGEATEWTYSTASECFLPELGERLECLPPPFAGRAGALVRADHRDHERVPRHAQRVPGRVPLPGVQRPERGRVDAVGHVGGLQAQLPHLRLAVPAHGDRLGVGPGVEHLVPAGHRLAVHRRPHRGGQPRDGVRVEAPGVVQDQDQARVPAEERPGVGADHVVGVRHVPGRQAPEPVPRARRPLQPRHARDHHVVAHLGDAGHEQARLRRVPGPAVGVVGVPERS